MSDSAPLGLIAGNGVFPRLFARGARSAGRTVIAVAHQGETDRELEGEVASCTWIRVGELGKLIRVLRSAGCRQAVMAGGIRKAKLFSGFRPDLRGAAFLARMRTLHDDRILRGIAAELESEGIEVIPSTTFLPDLLPSSGVLGRRKPRARDLADVAFGRRVARAVGVFEVGQTVVVRDRLGPRGRGGRGDRRGDPTRRRARARRRVVVKASKPGRTCASTCRRSARRPSD